MRDLPESYQVVENSFTRVASFQENHVISRIATKSK